MKKYLLITLTSPDRPGIVERITEVVTAQGGNWEESRLAHLGGDFAGIVKVSIAEDKVQPLADGLRALADDQLTVVVRVGEDAAAQGDQASPGGDLLVLNLTGADNEGIVHKVSEYLAEQRINVEAMQTEIVRAPITASPLFQMEARIKTPPGLAKETVAKNLERIGDDLGVDIVIAADDR